VAERRAAVVALHEAGHAPAAIARRLQLPRHTVLSDLAAQRRRAPVVALLRQLLLFDLVSPDEPVARPAGSVGRPAVVSAARRGRSVAGQRRRRAQPGQLSLPLCPDPSP
jgi:hypothetical protein